MYTRKFSTSLLLASLFLTSCAALSPSERGKDLDKKKRRSKNPADNDGSSGGRTGSSLKNLSNIKNQISDVVASNKSLIEKAFNSYNSSLPKKDKDKDAIKSENLKSAVELLDKYKYSKEINEMLAEYDTTHNPKLLTNVVDIINKKLGDRDFTANGATDLAKIKQRAELLKKQHDIETKLPAITNLLQSYKTGAYTDGGTPKTYPGSGKDSGYTTAKNDLNNLQNCLIPKTRSNFGNDDEYAKYLEDLAKLKKLIPDANRVKRSGLSSSNYVKKIEETYISNLKNKIGKGKDDPVTYDELRTGLNGKITEQKRIIDLIKAELLAKYKLVDPTYKGDDLPASFSSQIDILKKQEKLLKALTNANAHKNYATVPTADKGLTYSFVSFADEGATSVAKLVYDEQSTSYNLILNETTAGSGAGKHATQLKLSHKDFKKGKDNIFAYTGNRADETKTEVYAHNFMTKSNEYLNNGGIGNTIEYTARRQKLAALIAKFEAKKLSDNEKQELKKILGSDITSDITTTEFQNLSEADKNNLKTLKSIMQKSGGNLNIKKETVVTDTVKIGAPTTGLTYSDFGIWKVKESIKYSGDKSLIEKLTKDGTIGEKSNENNYAFAGGADKYKQGFAKDDNAGIEKETRFTGNTMAVATLHETTGNGKLTKDFNGTATLTVSNKTGKGNVTLDYKNWYGFKYKDIDVTNKNGFTSNDKPELLHQGRSIPKDNRFSFGATDDHTGSIKGQMFGRNSGSPTEAVGVFKVETNNIGNNTDNKYNKMTVDGAFGVKTGSNAIPRKPKR